jgi:class 3 adenylate cyclase
MEPDANHLTTEIAHVLFMDLVDYSLLPLEQQVLWGRELRETVRGAAEFQGAEQRGELLCLDTGDGMALVFFRNPVAPVQCAVEIASALRSRSPLKLRMGLHTGPVSRVPDINGNENVSGSGINTAQRVMDCGDAGHLLLSRSSAEILGEFEHWAAGLHDLGECEVKHGARVHLFNFYTARVGNPELPQRMREKATLRSSSRIPQAVLGAARRLRTEKGLQKGGSGWASQPKRGILWGTST